MEEDDIYQNKRRYNEFLKEIDELVKIPSERNLSPKKKIGMYYCKNKENLKFKAKLFAIASLLYSEMTEE